MLKSFPALVALVVVAALGAPRTATAGKLMLITRGEQIRELTPAPGAPTDELSDGIKVGHLCSYAGLFWIDFWTWDSRYCVYKAADDKRCQVIPAPVAAALLGVPEDQLPTPFFFRFPLGLVIVGGLAFGFGVSTAFNKYVAAKNAKLARRLITLPLYEKAMSLPHGERSAFLVSEGVPEGEVITNLHALTSTFEPNGPPEPPAESPPESPAPPTPPAVA